MLTPNKDESMAYRASIILMLAMFLGEASAQDFFSKEGKTRTHADSLMAEFTATPFDENLDFLNRYFPRKYKNEFIGGFKVDWARFTERKGEVLEFEHIKKDYIGRSFLRHYYLVKFKLNAIYIRLTYYKVQDLWHLQNFKYGENIEFLYEAKK